MLKQKKQKLTIEAMDLQEINNAIEVLKTKLGPYLQVATIKEKKTLAKMKDKSATFVVKALEHGENHPDFIPPFVDKEVMKNNLEGYELVSGIQTHIKEILRGVDDTVMVLGSDSYTSALAIYDTVKSANKNKVPGAKVAYEDLKIRFSRKNKSSKKEDTKAA